MHIHMLSWHAILREGRSLLGCSYTLVPYEYLVTGFEWFISLNQCWVHTLPHYQLDYRDGERLWISHYCNSTQSSDYQRDISSLLQLFVTWHGLLQYTLGRVPFHNVGQRLLKSISRFWSCQYGLVGTCNSTFILVSFPLIDILDSRLLPNFHFGGVNWWKKYWYHINIVVSRFNTFGKPSSAFRLYCIFLPDIQRWSMSPSQYSVSSGILFFGSVLKRSSLISCSASQPSDKGAISQCIYCFGFFLTCRFQDCIDISYALGCSSRFLLNKYFGWSMQIGSQLLGIGASEGKRSSRLAATWNLTYFGFVQQFLSYVPLHYGQTTR